MVVQHTSWLTGPILGSIFSFVLLHLRHDLEMLLGRNFFDRSTNGFLICRVFSNAPMRTHLQFRPICTACTICRICTVRLHVQYVIYVLRVQYVHYVKCVQHCMFMVHWISQLFFQGKTRSQPAWYAWLAWFVSKYFSMCSPTLCFWYAVPK